MARLCPRPYTALFTQHSAPMIDLFTDEDPDITTPADHPELQEMTERIGELRSGVKDCLRKAREHDRNAEDVGANGSIETATEAAEHEKKSDELRDEALEKANELEELEDRRDTLREEIEAEAQQKVDRLHASALREAAEATEKAVEAHRKLRKVEREYSDFIPRGPRHPDARSWLCKDDRHGSSGEVWVTRARELAAEKDG